MFRAEKSYAVTQGKWYFEFEAVTVGEMRVGWARPSVHADTELGADELAYVFNGYKVPVRRWASYWRTPYIHHIWAYLNMETDIMALGFVGIPKYGHATVRSAMPKYGDQPHPQIWSCVTSDL